jgi:carboxymethylenebutenolidase
MVARRAKPGHRGLRCRLTIRPAGSRRWAQTKEHAVPDHDLVAIWEAHCRYEFETHDADATMATMVDTPYVNHIPTMTGGVGHDQVKRFYKYHFIASNPADVQVVPVSRTVGTDQIVDELLFTFTHTSEIDWMLPGIAPTGRKVQVPLVAIVRFQDGKVAHEHIYWDQASVLVQIGKLDPESLPVAGIETAHKLADKTRPSNTLMRRWRTSEGKPI